MKYIIHEYDKAYLECYAAALQMLMLKLTGENKISKHYDPMDIDLSEQVMHSYAFDMKDGGLHHPVYDYGSRCEIEQVLADEAVRWIKDDD